MLFRSSPVPKSIFDQTCTAKFLLTVLYENRDLLVVDKPAGIKSHPNQAGEVGTLMNRVAAYLEGTNDAAYMVAWTKKPAGR